LKTKIPRAENPLLENYFLRKNDTNAVLKIPDFSRITNCHITPAFRVLVPDTRKQVKRLLHSRLFQFHDFFIPLETILEPLETAWSAVSHLHNTIDSPTLRKEYTYWLPRVSEFEITLSQNPRMYRKLAACRAHESFARLSDTEKRIITEALTDLTMHGAGLNWFQRFRFRRIHKRLELLSAKYSENVLDDTNSFVHFVRDKSRLEGLENDVLENARTEALSKKLINPDEEGWAFTLRMPSYIPLMKYAINADERRTMYTAYAQRASAGKRDNGKLIPKILRLRQRTAAMLGFLNYGEYTLSDRMAKTCTAVFSLLDELCVKSKSPGTRDVEEMYTEMRAGKKEKNVSEDGQCIHPWDVAYYMERIRKKKFSLSDKMLKPYFPLDGVMQGLFNLVQTLFGHTFRLKHMQSWHRDVRVYELNSSSTGGLKGILFCDLFAREGKQGGAWMDEFITRKKYAHAVQIPAACICANFTPPADFAHADIAHANTAHNAEKTNPINPGSDTVLLTLEEVQTLFHEMGHALHHLLTEVDYASVSGIHGVPWDGIELPSQLLECWCEEPESVKLFARHYRTGEIIPHEIALRIKEAGNFAAGYQMLRQIEFALFDMLLHTQPEKWYTQCTPDSVRAILHKVREKTALIETPGFVRTENSFTHIFAGGYAAGYYSYKWAEVLCADCFTRFLKEGMLNTALGNTLREEILSRGGGRDFMVSFRKFMGKEDTAYMPAAEALLKKCGLG